MENINKGTIWNSDAFGRTAANDGPDGDGIATTVNLRFGGQYYDVETGLHYNWNRYYDSATGRYISSDPIGLDGGLNTYSYVSNNPTNWVDPLGLKRKPVRLGQEYVGNIDTFDVGGSASFEIHVIDPMGNKVGLYGPEGWFNKHGLIGKPEVIPESVESRSAKEMQWI